LVGLKCGFVFKFSIDDQIHLGRELVFANVPTNLQMARGRYLAQLGKQLLHPFNILRLLDRKENDVTQHRLSLYLSCLKIRIQPEEVDPPNPAAEAASRVPSCGQGEHRACHRGADGHWDLPRTRASARYPLRGYCASPHWQGAHWSRVATPRPLAR